MSSPPPSNILLDPISELETALRTNAFGLDPSTTQIIYPSSFPITSEDKERVITESRSSGSTGEGVIARAEVGLIEGGLAEVVLDRRGYTLESVVTPDGKTFPRSTYETLEAMLIAISPGYVAAMSSEVGRRFEGFTKESGREEGATAGREDVRVAEGGEGWQ